MFRRASVLCALLCLGRATAQAQPAQQIPSPAYTAESPVVVRGDDGAVTVRATRVNQPFVLDGELKEEVYARVAAIDGFLQQEPNEGEPVTEQTQVWLFYDDRNIYVSARLHDSEPEREIITEM